MDEGKIRIKLAIGTQRIEPLIPANTTVADLRTLQNLLGAVVFVNGAHADDTTQLSDGDRVSSGQKAGTGN